MASMTTTVQTPSGPGPLPAHPARAARAKADARWQQKYSSRLRITDSSIVCAAVALAQLVRFGDSPNASGYPGPIMTLLSALFAALWLSSMSVSQTRSIRIVGAGIDEYRRIASASFWTFGIIAMVTLLAKIDLARGYLAVALSAGTVGVLTIRRPWRQHQCRHRIHGAFQ